MPRMRAVVRRMRVSLLPATPADADSDCRDGGLPSGGWGDTCAARAVMEAADVVVLVR